MKMSAEAGSTLENDRQEVLRLHNDWLEANRQQSTPMMRQTFVGGDKFHGINLNGFAYDGIEEWARLWDTFNPDLKITEVLDSNVQVVLKGDIGWVTYEATITLNSLAKHGEGIATTTLPFEDKTLTVGFYGTDICVREDEDGKPVWKMWRFHGSVKAAPGVGRPAFS
jgi:hypothetical protein